MRETPRAQQAWVDYLALGPDRSLDKLHRLYLVRAAESDQSGTKAVPTTRLTALKTWSAQFGWQARLSEIAAREAAEAEAREAEYRRSIMETGYAAAHERVKLLNRLVEAIARDLRLTGQEDDTDPRFWLRDVKSVGSGDDFERVEIERFNAAEVAELRAALADLASEKGDRVKRTELTGKDGGAIPVQYLEVVRPPDGG
jgi:hypothetical protein